ncbi:MAG: ATP-binding protein [Desulfurococcaceae archaeon]|nr:ATP-binding protein [Desulfurococcaceae archaeon]
MIRSIVVENLRGIKKCVIDDLRDVNIFIGRNGAGKSTILEAIYIASAFANERDELRGVYKLDYVVQRRGGRGKWNTFRDVLWFSKDVDKRIVIELRFSTGNTLRFVLTNTDAPPSTPVWPVVLEVPIDLVYGVGGEIMVYVGRDTSGKLVLWEPDYRAVKKYLNESLYEIFRTELSYLSGVVLLDNRIPITSFESNTWRRVLDKRFDRIVLELIKEEYEPGTESILFKPSGEGFALSLALPNTSIEIDTLGDGARTALLYTSAIAPLEGTGVLIEDPEAHQYPNALVTLMRTVLRLAKERKLQIFITTHSIELINIVKKLAEELGLGMKLYYLERDRSTGIVDARAMEGADIEVLQRLGLDPRVLHII